MVLFLCIAVPVLFAVFRGPSPSGGSDRACVSDSITQARIDSAQHRADSIASVRAAARARRQARRDSARAARAFRPAPRDRLRDVVTR
ncbi:MAG: hypothetical protein K2M12_10950 [Muribaculaceae bacterium]|nr:hypothetical protein [Muribaculaceae bacterium]